MACAPWEDSDQPRHEPSLIRVFAVHMKKHWTLNYLLSAQWGLIRLGRRPGWSESSLGIHAILLVLSGGGSNNKKKQRPKQPTTFTGVPHISFYQKSTRINYRVSIMHLPLFIVKTKMLIKPLWFSFERLAEIDLGKNSLTSQPLINPIHLTFVFYF